MVDRGYREAITYSFVDPAVQRRLFPDSRGLSLANPISADLSEMRVSLWTGLVLACRENLRRQQSRVRLFEIGKKFDVSGGGLPKSKRCAAWPPARVGQNSGASAREPVDFYDVKADVENVLRSPVTAYRALRGRFAAAVCGLAARHEFFAAQRRSVGSANCIRSSSRP